jgi:hypothetical protein
VACNKRDTMKGSFENKGITSEKQQEMKSKWRVFAMRKESLSHYAKGP